MSHTTRPAIRTPSLRIVKQTSLSEEKVTKCGKTRSIYVVVKNSPFSLSIALDGALTNLNHLSFDMSLIYDRPGLEDKEVSFVSQKPIDYKTILNDVGDQICFDVKIKVLSSHHEDNFFRLKVLVWDPSSEQFPQLEIISHPIKVISKPMNQRKTKKRAAPTTRRTKSTAASELETPPAQVTCVTNIESSLNKIDLQQQESIRLLNELLSVRNFEPPAKKMKLDPVQMSPMYLPNSTPDTLIDFESSFSAMLQFYSAMSAEEKAERMSKIVRVLPARDRDQLEELCDVMAHAGVKTSATDAQSFQIGSLTSSGGLVPDNYSEYLALNTWNWSND